MHVTACIVGFRNVGDVTNCVAALGRSAHRDLSVIICENGGPEAYAALTAALPATLPGGGAVRCIQASGNLGYAGGFNTCLAAATEADAWWLVNPDAEPEPDALPLMIERLARGDADAVGGTILLGDGRVQGYGGRFRPWLARAESIGHGEAYDPGIDARAVEARMNYILGASMLIGRRFIDLTGRMREDYFLYAEEVEWCMRGLAQGARLGFAPGAIVHHRQGSTTGSADSIARRPWLPIYLDERNKLNVVRDTEPAMLPVAALSAAVLIALRYARRGAWRQVRYALAGWWAGLNGRRGVPAALETPRNRD